ncbi:MAG: DUF3817 domain-containing protein [Corynebacteriales bacterium]|nr:DUF3817 domain-containing protein [Mycobacteriales bacterium]
MGVLLVRWFKIAAIVEAFSWAGLLIGMFLKRNVVHDEIGVKIFGPIHGICFIVYLITLAMVYTEQKWSKRTAILGVISSVPPFMTLWFERHITRQERKAPQSVAPAPVG